MNTRPSARITMPLQTMSHPSGCVVMVLACGSHMAARKFGSVGRFPEPATINTLPLFITARWTGLIGIRYGSVCHRPATIVWARTAWAPKPARPRADKIAAGTYALPANRLVQTSPNSSSASQNTRSIARRKSHGGANGAGTIRVRRKVRTVALSKQLSGDFIFPSQSRLRLGMTRRSHVMNTQSGTNRWPAFLLVGIVAVVVGVAAYNLGMSNGLARSAQIVAAPAVQPGIAPGAPGAPVFVYPYPYGWYRPWGFGFGF